MDVHDSRLDDVVISLIGFFFANFVSFLHNFFVFFFVRFNKAYIYCVICMHTIKIWDTGDENKQTSTNIICKHVSLIRYTSSSFFLSNFEILFLFGKLLGKKPLKCFIFKMKKIRKQTRNLYQQYYI